MSEQLLKAIGVFLYGDQWQAPLARDISVSERSMRRWAAGTDEIPKGAWQDIALVLDTVHAEAGNLLSEVKWKIDLVEVHSFEKWDQGAGEMVRAPGKATAERIAKFEAEPIPGTAEWVPASLIDAEGRLRRQHTILSSDEYDLLDELNNRGGVARISGGRQRGGAEKLVNCGYAVSRSLNLSDVEYEITELGKAAFVLHQFGINSTAFSVEPHRFKVDGRWYVKISGASAADHLFEVGSAVKVVLNLKSAGAHDIARRFEIAIEQVGNPMLG